MNLVKRGVLDTSCPDACPELIPIFSSAVFSPSVIASRNFGIWGGKSLFPVYNMFKRGGITAE